ncbi:uncharacterized protein LOC127122330 [Lathyrus oleraceus]|uniref:uncharacterized protein LOC127122330 n=1 Tax=Pisum sativum TaxID=3888 RepID=UPI0021D06197|nr:uncharacterized protein LOC127122330 [Pisum sativum]
MTYDRRGIHNYKLVESRLKVLRGLGARMILEYKEEFKKTYGNLLGIRNTEVNTIVVHTLVQFYDPMLRCFTFQYYQLAPTLEEYSHILEIGIKNRVPFVCTKELPKSHILDEALHLDKKEVELYLKLKGGIHCFTSKFLVDKATTFADVGSWMAFNAVLALLIYEIILFPNIEDFVDLDVIHIFLTKNSIPTILVDTYYSIHVRTRKKKRTIYSRSYDNVKLILNCGDFTSVPLLVTKGGINYNPRLALRQLGYPMVDKPDSKHVEDFALYEGVDNPELLKKIINAWGEICPKERDEMGKKNYIAREAYTRWVKDMVKEILLPFPSESSMSIKTPELIVNHISEVDKLKGIIKELEKESADL